MVKKRKVGEKRKSKVGSKIVCTLLNEVSRIAGAKGLPCSSLSLLLPQVPELMDFFFKQLLHTIASIKDKT